MNFQVKVRTDAHLFSIKKKIEERHGRITELRICKEQFSERNEMTDEMKTLQAYGIEGAPVDDPEVVRTRPEEQRPDEFYCSLDVSVVL